MITEITNSEEQDESKPPNKIISNLINKFDIPKNRIQEIEKVAEVYPMRISGYYFDLIKEVDDPIWKQCIPDIKEIKDSFGEEDPLSEEKDSPVSLITHRYLDRALFLISDVCEMYCRFCTRKRKVGTEKLRITKEKIETALRYIAEHTELRDIILSGGDALCVPIDRLEYILKSLKKMRHIEIIRIGTRLPAANPEKITEELCDMLKKYHPIYINVHFEHPNEITDKSKKACEMLADAGIPLGNQNVLLRGVNDSPEVMGRLYKELLKMRVKPYYLFQADFVKGTNHFRTNVETGLEIIENLREWTSGLAIPHYVIDAPSGGGKIPLIPDKYLVEKNDKKVVLRNYKNKLCEYPQVNKT